MGIITSTLTTFIIGKIAYRYYIGKDINTNIIMKYFANFKSFLRLVEAKIKKTEKIE